MQDASGSELAGPDGADEGALRATDAMLDARLLRGPATMGRREVSRGADVSLMSAQKFWHALGFPIIRDEAVRFTDADLDALRRIAHLVRDGSVVEETALAMTRALARTTDRLAVWQTQLMAEAMSPVVDDDATAERSSGPEQTNLEVTSAAAIRLVDLADELEPLLVYAWRRHLKAAVARMLSDAAGDDTASAPVRVVGFADLVNFTSHVRRMTERQLASMVQRFESLASDVVTAHGGRVIKTVGDEVLFVHRQVSPAAAIAIDLVETMRDDTLLPSVRVGMASGPVVSRLGDVFGTTVNRAARLTSVTPPDRVFVDDALARRLAATSGFDLAPQRRRSLRGIGSVIPSELTRAGVRRERPSGATS